MKKQVLTGIIVAVGLSLAACGSKETDSASSDGWEKIDDGTTADTEAMETPTGTDFAAATDEEATEIRIGRLLLEVPGYYSIEHDADGSYTCEYDGGTNKGALIMLRADDAAGMTEEEFAGRKDALADSVAESMSDQEGSSVTLVDSKTVEYIGMPGYSYDYEATVSDGPDATMDVDVFLNTDDNLIYMFLYIEQGEYDRDTATDYGNMMRNAQWAEASAEVETTKGSDFATSTEESPAGTSSSTTDASNVTPEIKEALDAYEEIMNQYVDFMLKYQDASSTDAISMLGDYTSMLSKYTDAMTALSKIDEGSLNTADLAYYLDVTNRVAKRLLEVGQ